MRIELNDSFTTLSVTDGTLQNGSLHALIEVATSTTENSGIVLKPGEILQVKSDVALYARSIRRGASVVETPYLVHEPFKKPGEGGVGVYTFKGSVATYDDLPTNNKVGDVYDIQTADETHGILAGDNVAWNGTSWDRLAGIYAIMQGATASAVGKAGLVPAPAAGKNTSYLRGDGTWEDAKDIFLSGSVPYGKELSDSWATLKAKAQAKNYVGIHIGDYKTITLTTGEVVICEVAGIGHDTRGGDTEVGGHIDFISRDCLAEHMRFNPTDTNNGTADEKHPWLASELYQSLNNETNGVYAKLPSDLKSCIIQKRTILEERYSSGGVVSADTGASWADAGKLWLPKEAEVFGYSILSEAGKGALYSRQYPIFAGGLKHIIKGVGNGGIRCTWWLLSAYYMNSMGTCGVLNYGSAWAIASSTTNVYVPLCFRIG